MATKCYNLITLQLKSLGLLTYLNTEEEFRHPNSMRSDMDVLQGGIFSFTHGMLALGRTGEPQRVCLHGMWNPRWGGKWGMTCMGGLRHGASWRLKNTRCLWKYFRGFLPREEISLAWSGLLSKVRKYFGRTHMTNYLIYFWSWKLHLSVFSFLHLLFAAPTGFVRSAIRHVSS